MRKMTVSVTALVAVALLGIAGCASSGSDASANESGGEGTPSVESAGGGTPSVTADDSPTSEDITVPDVVGEPGDEARDAIEDAGLDADLVAEDKMVLVESNWVVESTDPAVGASVGEGATVTVHVVRPDDDADDEESMAPSAGEEGTSAADDGGQTITPPSRNTAENKAELEEIRNAKGGDYEQTERDKNFLELARQSGFTTAPLMAMIQGLDLCLQLPDGPSDADAFNQWLADWAADTYQLEPEQTGRLLSAAVPGYCGGSIRDLPPEVAQLLAGG